MEKNCCRTYNHCSKFNTITGSMFSATRSAAVTCQAWQSQRTPLDNFDMNGVEAAASLFVSEESDSDLFATLGADTSSNQFSPANVFNLDEPSALHKSNLSSDVSFILNQRHRPSGSILQTTFHQATTSMSRVILGIGTNKYERILTTSLTLMKSLRFLTLLLQRLEIELYTGILSISAT